jgi:hypothetical protein
VRKVSDELEAWNSVDPTWASGIQKSLTAVDGQHLPAGSFVFHKSQALAPYTPMFTKPLPILEAKKWDSAKSRTKNPRFPREIGACAEIDFSDPVISREKRYVMFWKKSLICD